MKPVNISISTLPGSVAIVLICCGSSSCGGDTIGRDVVWSADCEVGSDVRDNVADFPVDAQGQCHGGPYCPCDESSDCDSGLCLETLDGFVCSRTCSQADECMAGWDCVESQGAGEGAVGICSDHFRELCRPCQQDADCRSAASGGYGVFKCRLQDANGSYCGADCINGSDCPEGYTCRTFDDGDGAYTQCVPSNGVCECSLRWQASGAQTWCSVENEWGICKGTRTCDEPCPAQVPAEEICNAIDDDCDGLTNEDVPPQDCSITNDWGTCPGSRPCQGIVWGDCNARTPAEETVNGVDDDCDGSIDEEN